MLNRKHMFGDSFPVVHKKVFQCDPLVTPESIRASQTAAADAADAVSFEEHVGVLVLEEVSVLHFRRTTHSCLFLTVRLDLWSVRPSLHHSHTKLSRGSSKIQSSDLFAVFPTPADFQVTAVVSSKWPQFAECAPHPSVKPTVRSQHRQLRARVLGSDQLHRIYTITGCH